MTVEVLRGIQCYRSIALLLLACVSRCSAAQPQFVEPWKPIPVYGEWVKNPLEQQFVNYIRMSVARIRIWSVTGTKESTFRSKKSINRVLRILETSRHLKGDTPPIYGWGIDHVEAYTAKNELIMTTSFSGGVQQFGPELMTLLVRSCYKPGSADIYGRLNESWEPWYQKGPFDYLGPL
jgi:hypothetical protein